MQHKKEINVVTNKNLLGRKLKCKDFMVEQNLSAISSMNFIELHDRLEALIDMTIDEQDGAIHDILDYVEEAQRAHRYITWLALQTKMVAYVEFDRRTTYGVD